MLDLYTHPGLSGFTEEVAKVLAFPAASHSCLHACAQGDSCMQMSMSAWLQASPVSWCQSLHSRHS